LNNSFKALFNEKSEHHLALEKQLDSFDSFKNIKIDKRAKSARIARSSILPSPTKVEVKHKANICDLNVIYVFYF
jgi:hypothetical protein